MPQFRAHAKIFNYITHKEELRERVGRTTYGVKHGTYNMTHKPLGGIFQFRE